MTRQELKGFFGGLFSDMKSDLVKDIEEIDWKTFKTKGRRVADKLEGLSVLARDISGIWDAIDRHDEAGIFRLFEEEMGGE